MTIGTNIKKYRKRMGLTQDELGKKLGIKQQTIAMYENDKTNIKHVTLEKIANALNVSISDLLPKKNGLDALFDEYTAEDIAFNLVRNCFLMICPLSSLSFVKTEKGSYLIQWLDESKNFNTITITETDLNYLANDIVEYFKFRLDKYTRKK